MTLEQLALFTVENGSGRRTVAEAGLRRGLGLDVGPERLLRELVKRGLSEEYLTTAATLVLELDAGASE